MEQVSNLSTPKQYSISIRFSSDGFSLFVYDQYHQVISSKKTQLGLLALEQNELSTRIKEHLDFDAAGVEVELIWESSEYTLVPLSLFAPQEMDVYYSFDHSLEKTHRLLHEELPKLDMVNVFSIPSAVSDALQQIFPTSHVRHHLSVLLESLKLSGDSQMHVWMGSQSMEIVVLKAHNFHLINSFPYHTKEDVVYNVLLVFEQLQLDSQTCGVQLYGSYAKKGMKDLLLNYVAEAEINSPDSYREHNSMSLS